MKNTVCPDNETKTIWIVRNDKRYANVSENSPRGGGAVNFGLIDFGFYNIKTGF